MRTDAIEYLRSQSARAMHDFEREHVLAPEPVPLGIGALDDRLGGGIMPGGFTVIGGTAGAGKSALGTVAAYNAAVRGECPLYISVEMAAHQVLARMASLHASSTLTLARFTWSNEHMIMRNRMPKDVADRWDAKDAEERVRLAGAWVDRYGSEDAVLKAWRDMCAKGIADRVSVRDDVVSLDHACGLVEERAELGVRDLVVVDYAQLLDAPGESEYERITATAHTLRALCKECSVPMLLISSLRNIGKGDDDPELSWFRGSGHIGYDAFAAIVLKRGEQVDAETVLLDAHIIKNRFGRIGTAMGIGFKPCWNSIV